MTVVVEVEEVEVIREVDKAGAGAEVEEVVVIREVDKAGARAGAEAVGEGTKMAEVLPLSPTFMVEVFCRSSPLALSDNPQPPSPPPPPSTVPTTPSSAPLS